MIKHILELLPYVQGETENIKIAKGKYSYPKSIREAYTQFKRELWDK